MNDASQHQVGGSHYTNMARQPFDLIKKINANFWVGNVIKYVARYKAKNGIEDLKKAMHYLEWIEQNHVFQPSVVGAAMEIGAFCNANQMSRLENQILWFAYSSQIYLAKCRLEELIEQFQNSQL